MCVCVCMCECVNMSISVCVCIGLFTKIQFLHCSKVSVSIINECVLLLTSVY